MESTVAEGIPTPDEMSVDDLLKSGHLPDRVVLAFAEERARAEVAEEQRKETQEKYANSMADYAKRDYGRCPCSGLYDNRFVEVRLTVAAKVVVLTDVPQGACPNCGSRVYKAEVLERIESLMKGQKVRKVQ